MLLPVLLPAEKGVCELVNTPVEKNRPKVVSGKERSYKTPSQTYYLKSS